MFRENGPKFVEPADALDDSSNLQRAIFYFEELFYHKKMSIYSVCTINKTTDMMRREFEMKERRLQKFHDNLFSLQSEDYINFIDFVVKKFKEDCNYNTARYVFSDYLPKNLKDNNDIILAVLENNFHYCDELPEDKQKELEVEIAAKYKKLCEKYEKNLAEAWEEDSLRFKLILADETKGDRLQRYDRFLLRYEHIHGSYPKKPKMLKR